MTDVNQSKKLLGPVRKRMGDEADVRSTAEEIILAYGSQIKQLYIITTINLRTTKKIEDNNNKI